MRELAPIVLLPNHTGQAFEICSLSITFCFEAGRTLGWQDEITSKVARHWIEKAREAYKTQFWTNKDITELTAALAGAGELEKVRDLDERYAILLHRYAKTQM